jgi:hypothetical protein
LGECRSARSKQGDEECGNELTAPEHCNSTLFFLQQRDIVS